MGRAKQERRRQGRPPASDISAGRETILAAALALVKTLPPSQVTLAAVAREAEVDPALVRYYFGTREALLFEVAQQIAEADRPTESDGFSLAELEEHIHRTFRFTRSAKYMQRLMVEELSEAESADIREKVRVWSQSPIDFYAQLQARDDGRELAPFDPLFLHLAVIGISDFFVSAQPLIQLLLPEGTNVEDVARQYERFVVRLIMDGLRQRT